MAVPAFALFANNAQTVLAGPISAGALSVNLAAGTGALFPSPSAGQYFTLTFQDQATGLIREIAWCTARSNDVCTITRAQEGTTALPWLAGDTAANWWTAGDAAVMVQVAQLQKQAGNYAPDTGAANAYVIIRNPTPASLATTIGEPIRVKIGTNNTGASTLADSGLAATVIVNFDGTPLIGGQLPAGCVATFIYDGTNYQFMAPGPSSGRWIATQVFSSPGSFTYTRSAGAHSGRVWVVGGGGAGGGAVNTAGGGSSVGGGGGSGAMCHVPFLALPATAPVVVGALGVAVLGAQGGGGGPSAFNTTFTANGGSGGTVGGAATTTFLTNPGAGGAHGSNGATDVGGNPGGIGFVIGPSLMFVGGWGGASPLFAGSGFGSQGLTGGPGQGAGAGGGGSSNGPGNNALPGGNGAPGIVIIEEYS